MTDAIIVHPRVEHMPPAALALAVLLHALLAGAIWWLSPLQPTELQEEPIMVMFDSSPSNVGLQDPARTGRQLNCRPQVPAPSTEPNRDPSSSRHWPPPSLERTGPALATLTGHAAARAGTDAADLRVLRAAGARAAAGTDLARLPQAAGRRATQAGAAHPADAAPTCAAGASNGRPPRRRRQCLRRCPAPIRPTSSRDRDGNATTTCRASSATSSPIASIRSCARRDNQSGRVVTRVTIDRDGGLIDVSIDSSSGGPVIDQAELEAIRKAAPFPPVPADMPGDPVILILRMTY